MKKIKLNKVEETIYEKTLSNGLTVCILKKEDFLEKCAFYETKYGSINNSFIPINKDKIKTYPLGIAHFLEHKLFESNEDENVFNIFENNGAYVNAATSFEKTYYYFNCTDNFEDSLKTLIKFVESPYFTDENVEKEKGIIGQEIDMRKDNPDLFLFEKLLSNAFIKSYYKDSIIGTKETIDKITKEDLYDCYNTFYNPSNMRLIIAGDIDVDKTFKLIEEIENKRDVNVCDNIIEEKIEEPDNVRIKKEEYKHNVTNKKVGIAYKLSLRNLSNEELYLRSLYIDIFLRILFYDISGFEKNLIKEKIVESYFEYDMDIFNDNNKNLLIYFFGDAKDEDKLKEKIDERIKNKNLYKDEKMFNLWKKVYLADYVKRFESVSSTVSLIRNNYHRYGKILNNEYDLLEKLSYNEYVKVIDNLNFNNRCEVVVNKIDE